MGGYCCLAVFLCPILHTLLTLYITWGGRQHPDKCKEAGATERFQALAVVHSVLADPAKRSLYDETGDMDVDETNDDNLASWYHWGCAYNMQMYMVKGLPTRCALRTGHATGGRCSPRSLLVTLTSSTSSTVTQTRSAQMCCVNTKLTSNSSSCSLPPTLRQTFAGLTSSPPCTASEAT